MSFPVLLLCFCFLLRPKIENKQPDARNARQKTQLLTLLSMKNSIPTVASDTTCLTKTKNCVRGNKMMVGMVVKDKVGDLDKEIREIFSRMLRKEMTGMVKEVVGKRRYLDSL